jgi:Holliday junction resolvasome RuvABC ATP-dependent DNA helicase subunit
MEKVIMEEIKNSLWVEKYRPSSLDTYIGNEHLKSKVEVYLESGDLPHLLLFGRAGTGKTTLQINGYLTFEMFIPNVSFHC